jgi:hypothetical protein
MNSGKTLMTMQNGNKKRTFKPPSAVKFANERAIRKDRLAQARENARA